MPQNEFPTSAELDQFESSYAGPHTQKLEAIRHTRRDNRNRNCLICLQVAESDNGLPAGSSGGLFTCQTCPRVLHLKCMQSYVAWLQLDLEELPNSPDPDFMNKKCALCVRRGWEVYNIHALKDIKADSDDWIMARAARKAKFEAAVKDGTFARKREDLDDDGSLMCDRKLLHALGVPAEGKMLFDGKADAEEEEPDVVVVREERASKKRKTNHT